MVTLARPTDESVSGYSRGFSSTHRGIDYGWKTSADINIRVSHDGTVLSVVDGHRDNGSMNNTDNQGWGNRIRVDHGNGIVTTYNHLKRGSAKVSAGQRVTRGQAIALMGNSGRSTGRHLHWELYINGERVDPEPYRTRDLPGLTSAAPASLTASQRLTKAAVKRRSQPTSQSAEAGDMLDADTIGNFTGWTHGENVEGIDIWFRGTSGNWFWAGAFTSQSTSGLEDLNAPAVSATQRVTKVETRRRSGPGTSYATAGDPLAAGTVGNFTGWTNGENVEGIDIWFQGISGDWFWAGGFTSQATNGLTRATVTAPTKPTVPAETATARTPVYPGATRGWSVPLGQSDRDAVTIDRFIVHHTTSTGSDEAYFKRANERSSAPTWYVLADGTVVEIIDPEKRPSATGSSNSRSVAVETQNTSGAPAWGISEASHIAIAKIIAWFYQTYNGKTLGGRPVRFTIDREHVIGHKEAPGAATACPGPSMNLDRIVALAKSYVEGNDPVTEETVQVSKSWLQSVLDKIKGLIGG